MEGFLNGLAESMAGNQSGSDAVCSVRHSNIPARLLSWRLVLQNRSQGA